MSNLIHDWFEKLGVDPETSSKKLIKELETYSKIFIPTELIYILEEKNPYTQEENKLFFLNINSNKYYENYGAHGKIEIYKHSPEKYTLLEPITDANQLFLKEKNNLSEEYILSLITNIPKKNIINVPIPSGEKEIKEHNKIYETFLSKNYAFIWGSRELKDYELSKIILSTGKFEPKKPNKVDVQKTIKELEEKLALQNEVILDIFNNINFHSILSENMPKNAGVVLFGPGGTGKTTIMKAFMEVFEELGSFIPKDDNNEILKTSGVRDTKFYGAYQDYFEPKFAEGIKEARKRGIPSFIPIDEGDIFVEDPKKSKNAHGPDVINFWKAHVGNHPEIIIMLATNVIKENLDPIASRAGRAKPIEIPLPNLQIAKRLILQFMKQYNIILSRALEDNELEILAKIVIENKKPGANIAEFCKNFHNQSIDYIDQYRQGKSPEEVEILMNQSSNESVTPEHFIERFSGEILGMTADTTEFISDKLLSEKINQEESDTYFERLIKEENSGVMAEFDRKITFSKILLNFYRSKKGVIVSSQNSESDKIRYYTYLTFIIRSTPNYFNNKEFKSLINKVDSKEKFEIFLEQLFNKTIKINNQDEFLDVFKGVLNNLNSGDEIRLDC